MIYYHHYYYYYWNNKKNKLDFRDKIKYHKNSNKKTKKKKSKVKGSNWKSYTCKLELKTNRTLTKDRR